MNRKLWGGRFQKATHNTVDEYNASITFDCALAYEDILGSLAHAKMLACCSIISANECEVLSQGLLSIANQIQNQQVEFSLQDEDIHMNIERLLHEMIGETAGKLHTARSRNDQVALDLHLYLRNNVVSIIEKLIRLQEVLLLLAKTNQKVILPGYTHLQRAQPISLATHLMAYFSMFQRDIERLQNNFLRINVSPLGAAALAGTQFKIDKKFVAEELGFDGNYLNTIDAVSDRDFVIEFISACALIMMHVSRLSEELIIWSSQEFGFITFDDAYSTGSSIMPQKKNPDVAELSRGKTGRVYGALISLLTVMKALPLAYNKDMQEDKEPLFDTIKTIQQTLAIYPDMLSSMKINADVMHRATQTGYLNATALAEYLVQRGLPFRSAHEVVGKIVAACDEANCELSALTLQKLKEFSPLIDQDVYQALSIEQSVAGSDKGNKQNESLLELQFLDAQVKLTSNITWQKTKTTILKNVYMKFGLELI